MSAGDPYRESVATFLDYLRDQRHVSEHTLRAYAGDLAQFGQFLAVEYISAQFELEHGFNSERSR